MKKFKKIIAMGCAAVMAFSAMSISAFADNNLETDINDSNIAKTEVQSYVPKLGDKITYVDEDGVEKEAVITEINEPKPIENMIEPYWYSGWFTNVEIQKNVTGNEGTQIGGTYFATTSDVYACFRTKNWCGYLNALNYALIDTDDNTVQWNTVRNIGTYMIKVPTIGHRYIYKFSGESATNKTLTCDLCLESD